MRSVSFSLDTVLSKINATHVEVGNLNFFIANKTYTRLCIYVYICQILISNPLPCLRLYDNYEFLNLVETTIFVAKRNLLELMEPKYSHMIQLIDPHYRVGVLVEWIRQLKTA